jgi:hypothetical protein
VSGSQCFVHASDVEPTAPCAESTHDGHDEDEPPEPEPALPPSSPRGASAEAPATADTGPWSVDLDAVSTSSSR